MNLNEIEKLYTDYVTKNKVDALPFSEIKSQFPEAFKQFEVREKPTAIPKPSQIGQTVEAFGRGAAEGLFATLPEQIGQAAGFLGATAIEKPLSDWASYYRKKSEELFGSEKEYGTAANIVYRGTEMLAPSLIPGGLAMKGAAALGAGTKALKIGAAVGAGLTGLSQARQTEKTAEARGVEPGIAPYVTGGIEAVGEYFGTKYLGKLFGLGEDAAKITLKNFLKTLGVETGTEFLQALGEASTEKLKGIRPEAEPLQEAFSVLGPTAFMTFLTGGVAKFTPSQIKAEPGETVNLATNNPVKVESYQEQNQRRIEETQSDYEAAQLTPQDIQRASSELERKRQEKFASQDLMRRQEVEKQIQGEIPSETPVLIPELKKEAEALSEERRLVEGYSIPKSKNVLQIAETATPSDSELFIPKNNQQAIKLEEILRKEGFKRTAEDKAFLNSIFKEKEIIPGTTRFSVSEAPFSSEEKNLEDINKVRASLNRNLMSGEDKNTSWEHGVIDLTQQSMSVNLAYKKYLEKNNPVYLDIAKEEAKSLKDNIDAINNSGNQEIIDTFYSNEKHKEDLNKAIELIPELIGEEVSIPESVKSISPESYKFSVKESASPIDRIKDINRRSGVNPISGKELVPIINKSKGEWTSTPAAWLPLDGAEGITVADNDTNSTHAAIAKTMGFTGDETGDINGDALKKGWIRKSSDISYEVYEVNEKTKNRLLEIIKDGMLPDQVIVSEYMGGKEHVINILREGDLTRELNKIAEGNTKFRIEESGINIDVSEPKSNPYGSILKATEEAISKKGADLVFIKNWWDSFEGRDLEETKKGLLLHGIDVSEAKTWEQLKSTLRSSGKTIQGQYEKILTDDGFNHRIAIFYGSIPTERGQAKTRLEEFFHFLVGSESLTQEQVDTLTNSYKIESAENGIDWEELAGDAFTERVINKPKGIQKILDVIRNFISKVRNGLQGMGFKTANDVYDAIYQKELKDYENKFEENKKEFENWNKKYNIDVGSVNDFTNLSSSVRWKLQDKLITPIERPITRNGWADVRPVPDYSRFDLDYDERVSPRYIEPLHGVKDNAKLERLVKSIKTKGWRGFPILTYFNGELDFALTGSHRLAAAKKIGTDIPIVRIDEDLAETWFKEHDASIDDLTSGDDWQKLERMKEIGDKRAVFLLEEELNKKHEIRFSIGSTELGQKVTPSVTDVVKTIWRGERATTSWGDPLMSAYQKKAGKIGWLQHQFKSPFLKDTVYAADSSTELMSSFFYELSHDRLPFLYESKLTKEDWGKINRAATHMDLAQKLFDDETLRTKYGLSDEQIAMVKKNKQEGDTAYSQLLDKIEEDRVESYNHPSTFEIYKYIKELYEIKKNRNLKGAVREEKIAERLKSISQTLDPSLYSQLEKEWKELDNKVIVNNMSKEEQRKGYYLGRFRGNGTWEVLVYEKNPDGTKNEKGKVIRWRSDQALFDKYEIAQKNKYIERVKSEYGEDNYIYESKKVDRLPEGLYQDTNSLALRQYLDKVAEKIKQNGDITGAEYRSILDGMESQLSEDMKARSEAKSRTIKRSGGVLEPEELDKLTSTVVQGYNTNVRESWLRWSQSAASLIGRMQFTRDINRILRDMGPNFEDPTMYDYIKAIQQDMSKPKSAWEKQAATLNSLTIGTFMAGSIRSALINPTQLMTSGVVELASEEIGERVGMLNQKWITKNLKAFERIGKAIKDLATDNISEEEKKLLHDGYANGKLQAQYLRRVRDQIEQGIGSYFNTAMDKLMRPFGWTEELSRKSMMLAGFRMYREVKKLDYATAFRKSLELVDNTMYNYNKYNDPEIIRRNAVGNSLYTLRRYQSNYGSWIYQSLLKGADGKRHMEKTLTSFLYLGLLGGLVGVPLVDDALEFLERLTGTPWRAKISKALSGGSPALERGILNGIPAMLNLLDISGSLKMSTPIPKDLDAKSIISSGTEFLLGPQMGMFTKGNNFFGNLRKGDIDKAIEAAAPEFITNIIKGWRFSTDGVTDSSGRPIIGLDGEPLKLSTPRALLQMLGFKSPEVGQTQLYRRIGQNIKSAATERRSRISYKIRNYLLRGEGNPQSIQEEIKNYNDKFKQYNYKGGIPQYTFNSFKQAMREDRNMMPFILRYEERLGKENEEEGE